jgi:hypothetical protein
MNEVDKIEWIGILNMRCLADFILDSDLCLVDGAAPLTLNSPDGVFSLTVSNADADHALPNAVLSTTYL